MNRLWKRTERRVSRDPAAILLAMVPAVMFPVLKRQNEALAVGYVVFRGALETMLYIGMALNLLLLAARTVSRAPCCSRRRLPSWPSWKSSSASAP
jgi:inner membrane protein involved in colicin E2 resistance